MKTKLQYFTATKLIYRSLINATEVKKKKII
jgi:hypothetical protein